MIKKAFLFLKLYFYALGKSFFWDQIYPNGIRASLVCKFKDPTYPKQAHGVVAFVLLHGTNPDDLGELFGPFGPTSLIDFHGLHLYGRDTWGTVNEAQLVANKKLRKLAQQNPGQTILLAGVRRFLFWHIWLLNDPRYFLLPFKKQE